MSLISILYRAAWKYVGRPFTYVFREWSGEYPLVATLMSLASLGMLAYLDSVLTGVAGWAVRASLMFACLLAGHLFWDTAGAYVKSAKDIGR